MKGTKSLQKIKDNTLKRRQKSKMLSDNYPEEGVLKVSNFIRLVDNKHIRFITTWGFKRSVSKEEWTILAQVKNLKLNYCQVVIIENPLEFLKLK